MIPIGQISGPMQRRIEESRRRYQRLLNLNPDITCLKCMDEGMIDFSTGRIPCPICEKGKAVEQEREHAAWLGRVERECGIPREIRASINRRAFSEEIVGTLRECGEQSRGAYLFGGVGRGKSVAAAAALLEFVRSSGDVSTSPRRLGYFITASDYLQGIRDSYGGGVSGVVEDAGHDRGISECARILVLDDAGVEYITDWGAEQITRLVDQRVTAGLPTIYTSNLTLNQLEQKYNRASAMMGSRIRSRIEGACEIIRVDGPDYRRRGQ